MTLIFLLIWDVSSGELLQLIALGNDTAEEASFSANGERIAARLERDSNVTVWECLPKERLLEVARSRTFRQLTADERHEYELDGAVDKPVLI